VENCGELPEEPEECDPEWEDCEEPECEDWDCIEDDCKDEGIGCTFEDCVMSGWCYGFEDNCEYYGDGEAPCVICDLNIQDCEFSNCEFYGMDCDTHEECLEYGWCLGDDTDCE